MAGDAVLVLGAGSWGTALGMVLARHGVETRLWDTDRGHVEAMADRGVNERHLPGIPLPARLRPVPDFESAAAGVADVVVAVPCEGLRDVLELLASLSRVRLRLCLASKGLAPGTLSLNHEVAREHLGDIEVAILSGPSFAREVAAGLPTAVTIASQTESAAVAFARRFHGDDFRIYTHDDVIGVQVGGAVKNVMAIAAGIADGLGFGANTRAALVTRGLVEIMRLGIAMGGKRETFMGLAGLGDLVLTCTDDQSRNRRLGLALARGSSAADAGRQIGQAVEGVRTAGVALELARRLSVEMPITAQVDAVIRGATGPREAVQVLLSRGPKSELAD
jgi:glycerol-3-phosphate dehydrogenase (NAD(P)+)